MDGEEFDLRLPALRENPFHSRPLEHGQGELLAGRDEITSRWALFIRQNASRMILLVGESGSGRTSLLQCMSSETEKDLHFDMFPTSEPSTSILEDLHVRLIGFDLPRTGSEVASKLVEITNSNTGPLPLITFDFQHVTGEEIAATMSRLNPVLRRLRALVVVALTQEQRLDWNAKLVNTFDHIEVLTPLNTSDVCSLAESRIEQVSNAPWSMPNEVAEKLNEQCGGHPGRLVRRLRDLVDEARSSPRRAVQTITSSRDEIDEVLWEDDDLLEEGIEEDIEIENKDPEFELDMQELDIPPPVFAQAPLPQGMFAGLASRNRSNATQQPRYDKTSVSRDAEAEVPVDENGTFLWMKPGTEPVEETEEIEELGEINSAVNIDEFVETGLNSEYSQPVLESNEISDNTILSMLTRLANLPASGIRSLSDALSSLRRPVIGPMESTALDVNRLRNLSKAESVLVEIAAEREYSPSDERLRDRLRIGRPRMSQLSNGLLRSGILRVQQKERSRYFSLSNDARAQLIAWGMLEEVAA